MSECPCKKCPHCGEVLPVEEMARGSFDTLIDFVAGLERSAVRNNTGVTNVARILADAICEMEENGGEPSMGTALRLLRYMPAPDESA